MCTLCGVFFVQDAEICLMPSYLSHSTWMLQGSLFEDLKGLPVDCPEAGLMATSSC